MNHFNVCTAIGLKKLSVIFNVIWISRPLIKKIIVKNKYIDTFNLRKP